VRLLTEDALALGGLLRHGKESILKIELHFPNYSRQKVD
jgi:hypothetical protein